MKGIVQKIFIFSFVLSSCVYNKKEKLPTPIVQVSNSDTTTTNTTTVTYTNFVKKVMDDNCVTCHSGKGLGIPPFLTTYDAVKTQGLGGTIKARVIDEIPYRMPPDSSLSQTTKNSLLIWLNNGLPE